MFLQIILREEVEIPVVRKHGKPSNMVRVRTRDCKLLVRFMFVFLKNILGFMEIEELIEAHNRERVYIHSVWSVWKQEIRGQGFLILLALVINVATKFVKLFSFVKPKIRL